MPNSPKSPAPARVPDSGYLSIRPDDGRPPELQFQYDAPKSRLGGAVGGSILGHAAFIGLWLLLMWVVPDSVKEAVLPDAIPRQLVWLAEPGPGGGGGGGNNRPEPPKPAELPGAEKISVPTPKPEPKPEPTPEETPLESLQIPVQTMAAATETTIGVLETGDASSQSTGSGT